jgi:hypothetical protein
MLFSPLKFLSAILLFSTVSQAAEPLQWKFQLGASTSYRLKQDSNTNIAMDEGDVKTSMSQTMDLAWLVESVDESGTAKVRQDVERVRMEMTSPAGQVYSFDSDSEDPPLGLMAMVASLLETLVAEDMVMTLSPRGEILNLDAPEKLLESMKHMPGAAAGGGDEALKQLFRSGCFVLPEGPLEKGQTWTTQLEMPMPLIGKQIVETTYKYLGDREVEGRAMAVFEPAITISHAEGAPAGPVEVRFSIVESDGQILFDRQAGRIATSKIHQKIDLSMDLPGPQGAEPKTITGTVDQTTTFENVAEPERQQPEEQRPEAKQKPEDPA